MSRIRPVKIGSFTTGRGNPLFLIAGPCVIESRETCMEIADALVTWATKEKVPLVFKASYDKANRTSRSSFRGPGLELGLEILSEIRSKHGVPVLTDVHTVEEVWAAAESVDVLQLPAFLCRQTDLAVALGETGKPVNVKKGQFLAPWDMKNIIDKITQTGNHQVMLTERGTSFGYNNLVVDMRGLAVMRELGYPVIFDATHSVQLPGGRGDKSGGDAAMVPCLARAAAAAGCDGMFFETHIARESALCDRDNMLSIKDLCRLWETLKTIHETVGP